MFAPGLMFNTIKSGLAVDFPIFTAGPPHTASIIEANANGAMPASAAWKHPSYVIVGNSSYSPTGPNAANGFDERLPFETLVEPERHLANKFIYDMEVHPSCSFSGSTPQGDLASANAHALWLGGGDDRYRLAMHNFLAETPEFFLENGTFTTFISKPRGDWNVPMGNEFRNTSYKMRVKLKKSSDVSNTPFSASWQLSGTAGVNVAANRAAALRGDIYPQLVTGSETMVMYSRPSAFGPPVGGGPSASLNNSSNLFPMYHRGFYGDSRFGYYPHVTPPYYDGEAWVDLEYNPGLHSEAGLPDLTTLLGRLTASYLRFAGPLAEGAATHLDQTQLWMHGLGGRYMYEGNSDSTVVPLPGPMSGAWECNHNSMQVSASVNLFGSTKGLSDILKYAGVDPNTNEEQWVIQTKFETPMLNFIDNSGSDGSTADGISQLTEAFATTQVSGGYYTRPIGMWHQLGRQPVGGEGIWLEITDVPAHQSQMFPERTTAPMAGTSTVTGSLADLVGFSGIKAQRLGNTASKKTIREAVVAVPFVEKEVTTTMPGPMGTTKIHTSNQKQFFSIDKAQIEYIWNPGTSTFPATAAGQSLVDMVEAMQRYVFPPSMDFITYSDEVDPISMYIFEFEHTLNRDDLMHIWQNLPPRIARSFDQQGGGVLPDSLHTDDIVQTKTITHPLQSGELLSTVDEKLQWMVFKVKQKAQTNYFRKVVAGNGGTTLPAWASMASQLNVTDAIADGAAKGASSKTDPYKQTYNWPYDFFSLVELVKINEQVVFESVERGSDGPVVSLPFGDTSPWVTDRPSAAGTTPQVNLPPIRIPQQPQTAAAAPSYPNIPPLLLPQQPQTITATPTITMEIPSPQPQPQATQETRPAVIRDFPLVIPSQPQYQTTTPTVRTFPVVIPQQGGGSEPHGAGASVMPASTANGANGQPQYVTNYGGAYSPFRPGAGQGGYYTTGGGTGGNGQSGGGLK